MRQERDSLGEMEVPDWALYGASTQRAVLNFPQSGLRFSDRFIATLGIIKWAAAKANQSLGLLPKEKAEVIQKAALEVAEGAYREQFVVDVFQTGSGTSTNMNANEVIANRALELLGKKRGDKEKIHPNDEVNCGQSSNDVIPTVIHIAATLECEKSLIPALSLLSVSLREKEKEFSTTVKAGRTHLQDATPVMLGQEFGGYAYQIESGILRIAQTVERLSAVALGGTAVGTGITTHPEFARKALSFISEYTGRQFRETENHFAAQGSMDSCVELSGQLKTVACSLMKIANDLRWLSSGPLCGLGEIQFPALQPGSSIMPAKVNPVLCESTMMVAAHVIGSDATITCAGQYGNFELHTMLPLIGYHLLQSITLLSSTAKNFAENAVRGITADTEKCRQYAERSLAICTALVPVIGYDKAAQVAKTAYAEGTSVRQAALDLKLLTEEELDVLLDLFAMTKPSLYRSELTSKV